MTPEDLLASAAYFDANGMDRAAELFRLAAVRAEERGQMEMTFDGEEFRSGHRED